MQKLKIGMNEFNVWYDEPWIKNCNKYIQFTNIFDYIY